MKYVIFDLEWNQPYSNDISFMKRTGLPVSGEIIQIGAIKLDEAFNLEDTFNILVKPQYLKKMHKHVSKLTHITTEDLELGIDFTKAYRHFEKWCGDDAVWLTWGSDDIVMLRENLKLYGFSGAIKRPWYDAQIIFAHLVHGDAQQVALGRAMEELNISQEELTAHDALHDAIFTGRVCKAIPLAKGLAAYDNIVKHVNSPAFFPDELTFFIYENFEDKRKVFRDRRVRQGHCPHCRRVLSLKDIQRFTGDKFISIGNCEIHGPFAVHWRIGRHKGRNGDQRFYVTKSVTDATDKLQQLYEEKRETNRRKEELYRARLAAAKAAGDK